MKAGPSISPSSITEKTIGCHHQAAPALIPTLLPSPRRPQADMSISSRKDAGRISVHLPDICLWFWGADAHNHQGDALR